MNESTKVVLTTLNPDGVTWRYFGSAQYPMDIDNQRRVGLIAQTNASIHPPGCDKARLARNQRKRAGV